MATAVWKSGGSADGLRLNSTDTLFAEWGPNNATGTNYTIPGISWLNYRRRNSTFGFKNANASAMFFGTRTTAERNSVYSNVAGTSDNVKRALGLFLDNSDRLAHTPAGRGASCWNGPNFPVDLRDWSTSNTGLWENRCKGTGTSASPLGAGAIDGGNLGPTRDNNTLNLKTDGNSKTIHVGFGTQTDASNFPNDIPWCGMQYINWNWRCSPGYPFQDKIRKLCYINSL